MSCRDLTAYPLNVARDLEQGKQLNCKEEARNDGRAHSSDMQPTVAVSPLLCSRIRRSVYFWFAAQIVGTIAWESRDVRT